MFVETRPSVNYAKPKDWLDQLFLVPGLVWLGELGCDHKGAVNNHFPVYSAIFGMVTPEETTKQTSNHVIPMQACSLPV